MNTAPGRSTPLSIVIKPDHSRLAQQIEEHFHVVRASSGAMVFREQLGLPTDRPIVMTGHQPTWWHAGILAKYIACDALASCCGASSAWIVPDQDEAMFGDIAFPMCTKTGDLERRAVQLAPTSPSGSPVAKSPVIKADLSIGTFAGVVQSSVLNGLSRLRDSLLAHGDEVNGARQVCRVLTDLMTPMVRPSPTVFASELHTTDLFRDLVEQMGDDPAGATQAYNRAVDHHPDAHVAPLKRTPERGRFELPLWRLTNDGRRLPVYSSELNDIPISELAPKALLMTGLLRHGACDLFIHGTGGGAYDRVTEEWLRDWLGVELAPKLVVSATLTLPLDDDAPAPWQVSAAVWKAHHARHHPGAIGDAVLQARRDELVAQIAREKQSHIDPAASFAQLHQLLDEHRTTHRRELDRLTDHAEELRSKSAQSTIAHDRTWPFFFHDESALRSLADEIRTALCVNAERAAER